MSARKPGTPKISPVVKRRVTHLQKKIAEARVRYPEATHREIAKITRTTRDNVSQEFLKPHVQSYIAELMEQEPALRDKALNRKLARMLAAKHKKFFAHEGIVRDERITADNGTQLSALDLAYQLKGHKMKRYDVTTGGDTLKSLLSEE